MILTEEYLQKLLDATLEQVGGGPWTVVLEGSIAEGFGNTSSDIDFLFVADGDAALPTMPSILFVDGRRVEVRTRSAGQLDEQFAALRTHGRARRPARLGEDLLNRCQRLLHCVPLRRPELLDRLAAPDRADFAALMTGWWAHWARQSLRQAVALAALGDGDGAVGWAQAGLMQCAKSWAARHGETYIGVKWLPMQLDRIGRDRVPDGVAELLERAPDPGSDAGAHLTRCTGLAAALGVTGVAADPGRLVVRRRAAVTTWPVADRVHVIRDRRDVFVLGSDAARSWRSVVFGRNLPDTLAAIAAAGSADPGGDLARFLRHGLIELAWPGGGPVVPMLPLAAAPGPVTPPPRVTTPALTLAGAAPSGPAAIDLLPLPADRFGAAAMALVWSNVLAENALEDLDGALALGQWPVAQASVRWLLCACLRALFSAHGVHPLPGDPELVHCLPMLPDTTAGIRDRARRLAEVTVTDRAGGEAARDGLTALLADIRADTGAGAFPSSFHSSGGWQATLDIGYDWLRLGAFLDSALPLDEARDLLTSGGTQPHLGTRES
jgi:hypothetical protein